MELAGKRLLVTGGAGFIGARLAERLVGANEVVALDRFSSGSRNWLPDGVELVEGDLSDPSVAAEAITPEIDAVFHFAADKSVAADDPDAQFRRNTALTATTLVRMRETGVRHVAFASSSTVYGEAPRPTPEDYAPLEPISAYGASKLAGEALASVYAHSYDFTVWTFRLANVVGPRLQTGAVIPDFVEKLKADPDHLEVLGDGRQEKSYLHVTDCVEAICYVVEHAERPVNTYNLGTRTTTSVARIAEIVAEEMGLDPDIEYTGGDRGWTGDVPRMRLSVEKLSALGWEPSASSDEAVRRAAREIVDERR